MLTYRNHLYQTRLHQKINLKYILNNIESIQYNNTRIIYSLILAIPNKKYNVHFSYFINMSKTAGERNLILYSHFLYFYIFSYQQIYIYLSNDYYCMYIFLQNNDLWTVFHFLLKNKKTTNYLRFLYFLEVEDAIFLTDTVHIKPKKQSTSQIRILCTAFFMSRIERRVFNIRKDPLTPNPNFSGIVVQRLHLSWSFVTWSHYYTFPTYW